MLNWFIVRDKLQCKKYSYVDLSVHESITHLLKTLGNRIHSFSNNGFVVKIYFFPPDCNINMSI